MVQRISAFVAAASMVWQVVTAEPTGRDARRAIRADSVRQQDQLSRRCRSRRGRIRTVLLALLLPLSDRTSANSGLAK
jgi:hypothetical protein